MAGLPSGPGVPVAGGATQARAGTPKNDQNDRHRKRGYRRAGSSLALQAIHRISNVPPGREHPRNGWQVTGESQPILSIDREEDSLLPQRSPGLEFSATIPELLRHASREFGESEG